MQERRRHARKPVALRAAVCADDAEPIDATCINISLGGAQFQMEDPPAYGSKVQLTIHLAADSVLTIPAIARWKGPSTLGVQFGSLRARDAYALSELVSSLDADK